MRSYKKTEYWRWYGLSALIIAVDQITKYWALGKLIPYQPQPVFPMFNLTLMFNKGAAWSFLSHWGNAATWLFSGIAAIISVVLIIWIYKLSSGKRWLAFGLALVLGGALSNLIDRQLHGYVVDFFDFYYKNWHFAAFNIADAAITVGAVVWFVEIVFSAVKPQ